MNSSFSYIKMVAIDCDETLVRSDNSISDYTVDVLHRLQQKGVAITIAAKGCCYYDCYGAYVPNG